MNRTSAISRFLALSAILVAVRCASYENSNLVSFRVQDGGTRFNLEGVELIGITDQGRFIALGRTDRLGVVSIPYRAIREERIRAAHFELEPFGFTSVKFNCSRDPQTVCLKRGQVHQITFPARYPFHVPSEERRPN
jgi:hypothetical protein